MLQFCGIELTSVITPSQDHYGIIERSKKEIDSTPNSVASDLSTNTSFLAAIVDSTDDAIIGNTLDAVIVSWNSGAERQYGYTAKEAIGKPDTLIIPRDNDETPKFLAILHKGELNDKILPERPKKVHTPFVIAKSAPQSMKPRVDHPWRRRFHADALKATS